MTRDQAQDGRPTAGRALTRPERLRRAQRRRDARIQLRVAADIFDRLDARPWAERARAELRASGETVAAGQGGEQLTPQELQIALLVTEGKTNAEIGRTVFLSTRTVEFHLSRTYRKLGVSTRTELTRHLAATGTLSIWGADSKRARPLGRVRLSE
jgi:DNA-binding NarL/FixJ family response regulator